MERLVSEGRTLVSVVHPSALVAASTLIEDGCFLTRGFVVGPYSRIG